MRNVAGLTGNHLHPVKPIGSEGKLVHQERTQLDIAWNHSHPVKPTGSG